MDKIRAAHHGDGHCHPAALHRLPHGREQPEIEPEIMMPLVGRQGAQWRQSSRHS
jgi:hypothetical protein